MNESIANTLFMGFHQPASTHLMHTQFVRARPEAPKGITKENFNLTFFIRINSYTKPILGWLRGRSAMASLQGASILKHTETEIGQRRNIKVNKFIYFSNINPYFMSINQLGYAYFATRF